MKAFSSLFFFLFSFSAFAQNDFTSFTVSIEPLTIENAPGVHSYTWAKASDGKWLVFGGRLDGLHQRQPFAAFLAEDNNTIATVIDVEAQEVWTKTLQELPTPIFEQLQSTNQNFIQVGNKLVTTGGYGYSPTAGDHITHPDIAIIDVDEFVAAIVGNQSLTDHVRQIEDTTMALTGGQMGYMDGVYYLVGGQEFVGRYNPMGPNNGPGFYQKYSDQVRKFTIDYSGVMPVVTHLTPMSDAEVLPRRDYNMSPQIFKNGDYGFTVFSGVFKQPDDTPFFDLVNISENSFEVVPDFTQILSSYHSAKIPMFDSASNTMHTIFFGGIAQYYYDETGTLVNDKDVPFVKTISRVTRLNDGTYEEVKLNIDMPTLVGAGAEFIPVDNYFTEEILNFTELPESSKTLVGYIYGGINSSAPNIFFDNDGNQSFASNTVFKVYIDNTVVGLEELKSNGIFDLVLSPNPTGSGYLLVDFNNPHKSKVNFDLYNLAGQRLKQLYSHEVSEGGKHINLELGDLASGQYVIRISNGTFGQVKTFVVQ